LADRIVGVKGGWTTLESRCLVPFNASKNRRFEKGMHLDLHKKRISKHHARPVPLILDAMRSALT